MLRRTLIAYLFIGFAAVGLIAGGAWKVVDTKTVYMNINDDGDTAQVMTILVESEVDSFDYIDTFVVNAGADSLAVGFLTPVQKMVLTLDSDSTIDSGVYYDTLIFTSTDRLGVKWVAPLYEIGITPTSAVDDAQYVCSVKFEGDTLVATWTAPSSATSIAMVCDSLVDSINNTTNLKDSVLAVDGTTFFSIRSKFATYSLARFTVGADSTWDQPGDTATISANSVAMFCDSVAALIEAEGDLTDSVTAHDSGTYVLVTSLFGGDTFGGRFTVKQTGTADNNGQDTASHATLATIAMVCDSLVSALTDSIATYVTVVDDDTGFTATAVNEGWAFLVYLGDTATDTVHTQLNVTSYSTFQDTIDIGRTIFDSWHATSIDGRFILSAAADVGDVDTDTILGIGKADSGYLILCYSTNWGALSVAAADTSATLPCTLAVSVADAEGNNVVFKNEVVLIWRVADTASDTTGMTIDFDIDFDYTLKD